MKKWFKKILWCPWPSPSFHAIEGLYPNKKEIIYTAIPAITFFIISGVLFITIFAPLLGFGQPNNPIIPVTEMKGYSPILIQCNDGSFMIAYITVNGIYVTNSENGTDWDAPRKAVEGDVTYYSFIQLQDGTFMITYTSSGYWNSSIYVTTSSDGISWSTSVKTLSTPYHIGDISIIQLQNGSYMIAYEGHSPVTRAHIEVRYSEDGTSWGKPLNVPTMSAQRITLTQTTNGSFMIATCDTNRIILYESTDGIYWSQFKVLLTNTYLNDFDMVQTVEGDYVVSYSDVRVQPYKLHIMAMKISDNQTTSMQITDVGKECLSPSIIQRKDGSFMFAFIYERKISAICEREIAVTWVSNIN